MTRSGQADGIILMSHRLPFGAKALRSAFPPIVAACEFSGCERFPTVSVDDRRAAADATTHLLELGHRAIAVITGATASSRDRLSGFRHTMQGAGIAVDESLIVHGAYSPDSGAASTDVLLEGDRRPTAIFCFSDEIALGSIFALRQRGLEVPKDVSVMGFDDIDAARYYAPPLCTIAQPRQAIGELCATLLFDVLAGRPSAGRHILPHRLVVRDSTRPV